MTCDEVDASQHDPPQYQAVALPQAGLFERRQTLFWTRQNLDAKDHRENRTANQACGDDQALELEAVHDSR